MGETEEKRIKTEPIVILACLVYFAFLGVEAWSFPKGAMYFPVGVAVTGTLACLALLWRHRYSFTGPKHRQEGAEAADDSVCITVIAISGIAGYLIAVMVLGYVVATIMMALAACFGLKKKSNVRSVASFTGILVLFIWVVFRVLLKVEMPRGILW